MKKVIVIGSGAGGAMAAKMLANDLASSILNFDNNLYLVHT